MPHPPLAAAHGRHARCSRPTPRPSSASIAGQLACLRELTLFYAPNINSYKRFAKGSFAPTAVAWGRDNRTCAVRVVGHGDALRVELRVPGADVNPYLALAAMIAAGLHGLEHELELEPALEGNAYVADKPHVPTTLGEARYLFADSERGEGGLRRGGRRPLPELRPRRAGGLRVLRHRLGARRGGSNGCDRATRSSRRSSPRPRSRRPWSASARRSSSACCRRARGCRRSATSASSSGIARSTLRQALTALVQSGHLHAVRGRGGGTFVADAPLAPRGPEELADWRDRCDVRLAVELGVAVLAAERADADRRSRCSGCSSTRWPRTLDDFTAYRLADVRFHVGLAEATGSHALVAAMTEAQGAMTDLISYIAHPPEVLAWSNAQHARLVDCLERRDPALAMRIMADHLRGTEHVLAGLLP